MKEIHANQKVAIEIVFKEENAMTENVTVILNIQVNFVSQKKQKMMVEHLIWDAKPLKIVIGMDLAHPVHVFVRKVMKESIVPNKKVGLALTIVLEKELAKCQRENASVIMVTQE